VPGVKIITQRSKNKYLKEHEVKPEFNSTKKEKKSHNRFKMQGFGAFKNDIKDSHITEVLSNEYLS